MLPTERPPVDCGIVPLENPVGTVAACVVAPNEKPELGDAEGCAVLVVPPKLKPPGVPAGCGVPPNENPLPPPALLVATGVPKLKPPV